MSINSEAIRLAEAIKAAPEFTKLKQMKSVINKNPGLKKELDEFDKSQKQLYSGQMTVKEAEVRAKQLNDKLENLMKIPEVNNYLKALNDFNRMIEEIYKTMNECLEKGLQ